jgi:hypothetical protein
MIVGKTDEKDVGVGSFDANADDSDWIFWGFSKEYYIILVELIILFLK